jgi:hypothetical protein
MKGANIMAQKIEPVEQPLNATERFLYAVAVRLDVLIEQNNSIIEHIAKQDGVATTNAKVETKVPVVEVVEEKKKPTRKKVK